MGPVRGGVAGLVLALGVVQAEPASAQTRGRWIGTATSAPNQWLAFRRSVDLPSVPARATARIAADSKYWLYVNGSLVVFEGGLKRGPNPADGYVDEVDLLPHLRAGRNTVAVLVWYFGRQGFSHKDSGRAGFLLEADGVPGLRTDAAWKARVHPGFGTDPVEPAPNYRLPEWNLYYDARLAADLGGWTEPAYDDAAWPGAVDLGPAGAAPWNALVPRPIPLFRFTGLSEFASTSVTLPAVSTGQPMVARLPGNLQVTWHLKVRAAAGQRIDVRSDRQDEGNATSVRGAYVTTDGVQSFESPAWMSGTALHFLVPAGVEVLELRYRESGYAVAFDGRFASGDAELDTLWEKARRTTYLNMRDTWMDCPTRERAQWWGDVVNELEQAAYGLAPGAQALTRKAILELAAWRRSDGTLYSPVPSGNWDQELPMQMLAAVWSLWSYYLHTGDVDTLRAAYPAVRAYLDLWTVGADGLVVHRAGEWDWWDWGTDIDVPVHRNAWYAMALDSAARLAPVVGQGDDAARWQARRSAVAAAFDAAFWDASRGAYRSPGYAGDTDDRASALAVVSGLAPAARYPDVLRTFRTHANASPFLERFVLEALYQMEEPAAAEARMRSRFGPMVADPMPTLWELWTKDGTLNHAWSGGPLYLLSAYAAGLRPTGPAWQSFAVVPRLGALGSAEATVATPRGTVTTRTVRTGTSVRLTLTVPAGTRARVGLPLVGASSAVLVQANGTLVWRGASVGGVAGLAFAGDDGRRLLFDVQPGTWTLVASLPPAAPVVASPSAGATIEVSGVTFAWAGLTEATRYEMRVVDRTTGRTVFTGALVGAASTQSLVSLPSGSYTFEVAACLGPEAATCGAASRVAFAVALSTPGGAPSVTAPAAGALLATSTNRFTWSAVAGAETYEVVVRDRATLRPTLQIRVPAPGTETIASLPGGSFEVLVRACRAACGTASTPVPFSLSLPAAPVSAPTVTTASGVGNALSLAWTAVGAADLYRVEVVQPPPAGPGGGALTVASRQVSSTSATLTVPRGAANVLVRACTGNGCGPPSAAVPVAVAGADPASPQVGFPVAGTAVAGPTTLVTWSRMAGDNGSNTLYRLYVQDLSRQAPALDVVTRGTFHAAYFRAEGSRYDATVIATRAGTTVQGSTVGFTVEGTSSPAPTMAAPAHGATASRGNVGLAWTPVPGSTLYEYYVALLGVSAPVARGVTPGLFVQVPLTTAGTYSAIARACVAPASCGSGSDEGWGPWSNAAGPGVTNFTVE